MNNKGEIPMVAMAISILVIGIIGVGVVLPTATEIIGDLTAPTNTTLSFSEIQPIWLGLPTTLNKTDLVAGTTNVNCSGTILTENTDYTMDNPAGLITGVEDVYSTTNENHSADWYSPVTLDNGVADMGTFVLYDCANNSLIYTLNTDYGLNGGNAFSTYSYPRNVTAENFTALFDTNVTLNQNIIANWNEVVYNCTNDSQTFDNSTDYNIFSDGNIDVLSTGTMTNDTLYCIDYYYSLTADGQQVCADYDYTLIANGDNCSIDYQYISGTGTPEISGTTALIIGLLPVIIAVIVLVGLIGFMRMD